MVENDLVHIGTVGRPPGGVCLGLVRGVIPEGDFFSMCLILRRHLSNAKSTSYARSTSMISGQSSVENLRPILELEC